MAGTWPLARAALVAQLDGITWEAAGSGVETLDCYEFPPSAAQQQYPHAYLIPSPRTVRRAPGGQRVTDIEVRVRFVLAPAAAEAEKLSQRYEAAIEAVADALDDAIALDGNADAIGDQEFTGLEQMPEDQDGWGFSMTLPVRVSETKTFSA